MNWYKRIKLSNTQQVIEKITKIIDGVEYKLFENERANVIRVLDIDSGEVVQSKGFPKTIFPDDFKARDFFNQLIEKVTKTAQSLFINPEQLTTEELSNYIDKRYEEGATQEELNKLETSFARRISEEETGVTEEELDIDEGISLEEQLVRMYHRYITPSDRHGMDETDILNNMRSVVRGFGGREDITDEELLSAARDIYETTLRRRKLQTTK